MDKKEMIEGLEAIRDSFDINTAYHKFVVQETINTLKEKTEPVAEVPCSDGVMPASKKETFIQFYFTGDDPVFICGVDGHMTGDCMEQIETQANRSMEEDDYFQEGAGDYLFKVYQEAPVDGENGETFYSGCWILDQVSFEPLKA